MSQELVNLQEIVRNQIRETVMKAVPNETIDKIVNDYFNGEFKTFVQTELRKQLEIKFKEDIGREATHIYDNNGKQVLTKVSADIASAVMQGFQQSILNTVMSQLQNSTFSRY